MLKASKHEATFKIRKRLRPVRDDHVIGARCKHSNVLSRGVLISRFLLGNLRATSCDISANAEPISQDNFVLLHGMNNSVIYFYLVLNLKNKKV